MADEVVSDGGTRRRPARDNTPLVQVVLERLDAAGVAWAPRFLGIGPSGSEILTWLPGRACTSAHEVDLLAIARVVRELHDLTADLAGEEECVIHDDVQPRNVVLADDGAIGLIDWEQIRPGPRVEDLAGLCWSFCEPFDGQRPQDLGEVWRGVLDKYGYDRPELLVPTLLRRITRCADDIRRHAEAGSARHLVLLERGDLESIVATEAWVKAHADALASVVARR